MQIGKIAAAVTLLTLLAGCNDAENPLDVSSESIPGVPQFNSVQEAQIVSPVAQKLARALAMAMQDAQVRTAVRNAMRESPYVEHKLVLQEFVATESGRMLLSAAAKAVRAEVPVLERMITKLPSMDFYAPFSEHRLAWAGGPGIVVGATMDQDNPEFVAYGLDGAAAEYDARKGAPNHTVLILHPAEPKSERPDAGVAASGLTIEALGAFGAVGVVPPSQVSSPVGTAPSLNTTTTASMAGLRLDGFRSSIKDGVGSAELRWIIEDSNYQQQAAKRWDGIYAHPYDYHYKNYYYPSGATGPYVHVREIDTWDSDDFGRALINIGGWTYSPETFYCGWEFDSSYCNPNDIIARWSVVFYSY